MFVKNYIYESEFGEIIKNILSEAYGLKDEILEEYLLSRYLILNKKSKFNKIDIENFCEFIAEELYINHKNGLFFYNDVKFYITNHFNQSIYNIVLNWSLFSKISGAFIMNKNEISRMTQIETYSEDVIRKGKNKLLKIKEIYKEYVYRDCVLTQLNSHYGIKPKMVVVPPSISPIKEVYYSGRNLEEVCRLHVESIAFNSNQNDLVLEKDIEQYLSQNIHKVFPGKRVLSRQKNIGNGCIIDMIIEDDDYEYIVELKNKKDDRLYWQIIKYYNYYKGNKKPVRVVSLAPEYSDAMLEKLKEIEYLNIFLFSLKIENMQITDMSIKDISKNSNINEETIIH